MQPDLATGSEKAVAETKFKELSAAYAKLTGSRLPLLPSRHPFASTASAHLILGANVQDTTREVRFPRAAMTQAAHRAVWWVMKAVYWIPSFCNAPHPRRLIYRGWLLCWTQHRSARFSLSRDPTWRLASGRVALCSPEKQRYSLSGAHPASPSS